MSKEGNTCKISLENLTFQFHLLHQPSDPHLSLHNASQQMQVPLKYHSPVTKESTGMDSSLEPISCSTFQVAGFQ
jgi:hypothetical protein